MAFLTSPVLSILRRIRRIDRIFRFGVLFQVFCGHYGFKYAYIVIFRISAKCEHYFRSGKKNYIIILWKSINRVMDFIKQKIEVVERRRAALIKQMLKKNARIEHLRKIFKLTKQRAIA